MPELCCIMGLPSLRPDFLCPGALAKVLMRTCLCFFFPPGVRTEQDLYVRLIDSMTKQVRKFDPPPRFSAARLGLSWGPETSRLTNGSPAFVVRVASLTC